MPSGFDDHKRTHQFLLIIRVKYLGQLTMNGVPI